MTNAFAVDTLNTEDVSGASDESVNHESDVGENGLVSVERKTDAPSAEVTNCVGNSAESCFHLTSDSMTDEVAKSANIGNENPIESAGISNCNLPSQSTTCIQNEQDMNELYCSTEANLSKATCEAVEMKRSLQSGDQEVTSNVRDTVTALTNDAVFSMEGCNNHGFEESELGSSLYREGKQFETGANISQVSDTSTSGVSDANASQVMKNSVYGESIERQEEELDQLFDPTEVLNVEIAPQESNKNTQASEPCKKVQGEAVERTHTRVSSNQGCLFIDQEDSIDSNIDWSDEDGKGIDLDYSPPLSPVGSEHMLFPAPQMNYHSIYSQDTVSLSEISFSEPEHDAPPLSRRMPDNDYIESLAMLSIESNEQADLEDHRCHTPPINLDRDGGVELTEGSLLQHTHAPDSSKTSTKGSTCSTPSIFEIDTPLPMSPHSVAEKVSERLRLLADSWADIPLPNCGSIQSIAVTDTLVWCVDNHEHLFVTPSSTANVNWKRVDGRALKISANQSGTIIWGVNRKRVASCRTNVRASNPQGKFSAIFYTLLVRPNINSPST